MLKRVFWLSVGVVVGSCASFWLNRRVRRTVARYLPERLALDAVAKVRSFGTDLRDAAREGRATMRDREASLRAEMVSD